MDEAKRLNMLDGHFFWLWIDASKDMDVFHNIGNRTQFSEDPETDILTEKIEAPFIDRLDRSKRNGADNNTIKDPNSHLENEDIVLDKDIIKNEWNLTTSPEPIVKSSSKNYTDTHTANGKLLELNFSQYNDSIRNNSLQNFRSNNVHNGKGVESSKIENYAIEKGKIPIRSNHSNVNRRSSYKEKKNESFNKYVNSIHINESNDIKRKILEQEFNMFREDITDIKDKVSLASDISDFLLNPTVHTNKMHNFRDTIEKRSDKIRMMKPNTSFDDEERAEKENNDDISVIINSLPVGLLAIHPQPAKIGKFRLYLDRSKIL